MLSKKKASYVLTVKGNQGSLREQIQSLIQHAEDKFPEILHSFSTVEKGHGRIEQRELSLLSTHRTQLVIDGIQQVARLRRTREIVKTGVISNEEIFLITNLPFEECDAERLFQLKRSYWDIENKLHYRKDFVFGEDRSTIRAKFGPRNMSTLRNFAIGLLNCLGVTNIKRCVDNLRHDPLSLLRCQQPYQVSQVAVT